jgi:hypothetical protein
MAVITDRFVYLHIPKTGGSFFTQMIEEIGTLLKLKYVRVAGGHTLQPLAEELLGERVVMIGIRHPVSWLRSLWMHVHRAGGGHLDFDGMPMSSTFIESARSAPTFPFYVDAISKQGPLISRVFASYGDAYGSKIDVLMIHRETIASSFMRYAQQYGILEKLDARDRERVADTVACMTYGQASNVPKVDHRLCAKIRESDPNAFLPYWY